MESSLNKFKNNFIDYFKSAINKKIPKEYNHLLEHEKYLINYKYLSIIFKINYLELFFENLLNNKKNSFTNNTLCNTYIDLSIKHIQSLISNTNKLKKNLLLLKDSLEIYKEKMIISEIIKYEKEEINKSFINQKDILTFENLFKQWKLLYSKSHIKKLKKQYNIDKKTKNFEIKLGTKNIKVKYLYTSNEYLNYIDMDLMDKIDVNDLIKCIEKMGEGKSISFFGIDEEIDYSNVGELED